MTTIDFIVKLGGSALTNKSELEMLNHDAVRQAGQTLLQAHQHGRCFVIVHGAGSFGHHHAKKAGVKQGYSNMADTESKNVKMGFCKTRISVCKLNQHLVEEFCNLGLPVVGISPAGSWITNNGQVTNHNVEIIQSYIQAGLIPVLHGDAVIDTQTQCTILSGDTIMKVLSEKMIPRQVVFVSDVEGVYTKHPELQGAELIEKINVNGSGEILTSFESSISGIDVTGGIGHKVQSAVDICVHGKAVIICGINSNAFQNLCINGDLAEAKATTLSLYE